MKVVLDTNSLLVSIPSKSEFRIIFDCILSNKINVLVSNEILLEYAEILNKKANKMVAENLLDFLRQANNVIYTDIYFNWQLIQKDADDNKFVDCAINGNADYLITDDKHFNALSSINFPFIKIIKTSDFVKILNTL